MNLIKFFLPIMILMFIFTLIGCTDMNMDHININDSSVDETPEHIMSYVIDLDLDSPKCLKNVNKYFAIYNCIKSDSIQTIESLLNSDSKLSFSIEDLNNVYVFREGHPLFDIIDQPIHKQIRPDFIWYYDIILLDFKE